MRTAKKNKNGARPILILLRSFGVRGMTPERRDSFIDGPHALFLEAAGKMPRNIIREGETD